MSGQALSMTEQQLLAALKVRLIGINLKATALELEWVELTAPTAWLFRWGQSYKQDSRISSYWRLERMLSD